MAVLEKMAFTHCGLYLISFCFLVWRYGLKRVIYSVLDGWNIFNVGDFFGTQIFEQVDTLCL